MDFLTVLIIALALAVDAFAVALATGVCLRAVDLRQTFRLGFHFGLFQGLMNIAGWAAGLSFRALIESVDHWLAFGLLALVGVKMIVDALRGGSEDAQRTDPTRGASMVILSVATSIDALAVGLSFSLLNISIWMPALVIGITAAILTTAGLHIGCRLIGVASKIGAKVEIFGGLVLIGIGIKVLYEHGVF